MIRPGGEYGGEYGWPKTVRDQEKAGKRGISPLSLIPREGEKHRETERKASEVMVIEVMAGNKSPASPPTRLDSADPRNRQ